MDEVKDMRNIIKTEFLKLKRYSVIKAGIIMTTLFIMAITVILSLWLIIRFYKKWTR